MIDDTLQMSFCAGNMNYGRRTECNTGCGFKKSDLPGFGGSFSGFHNAQVGDWECPKCNNVWIRTTFSGVNGLNHYSLFSSTLQEEIAATDQAAILKGKISVVAEALDQVQASLETTMLSRVNGNAQGKDRIFVGHNLSSSPQVWKHEFWRGQNGL